MMLLARPCVQSTQAWSPVMLPKVPAGHALQTPEAYSSAYLPKGHASQYVLEVLSLVEAP